MKVLLINIDSKKIPNLALKKIEKYHLDNDDEVIWDFPLMAHQVDKIYVSCVFEKNKDQCKQWEDIAHIGGSGYDIEKKLPDILENIKPKINLGFTTRGCIRNCKFCIVPQKEGKIRVVGDLLDLWDGKSKDVVLLDNNILALPDHFKMICKQARDNNIRLDFNQGLDCRLLNKDNVNELRSTKTHELRFAWDNPKDEKRIVGAIKMLKKVGINRSMFYVLVGFDTTKEEDLYRLEKLKSLGQRPYCMRYKNIKGNRFYNDLASWVNQQRFFASMDFETFQKCRKNRSLLNTKYNIKEDI